MMHTTQDTTDLPVSRSETESGWQVALDLHPLADDEVTVELLGDTAVVAVDTPVIKTEYDIDLPSADATATLHNGVLVIEAA